MKQFLNLPFSKHELTKQLQEHPHEDFLGWLYNITEWYVYNVWGLHWYKLHAGVDYHLPYWSNIYAPCNWFVTSGYNFQRATNDEWVIREKDWQNISYWLGYCVQIYHPQTQLFFLFWHLSYIARQIPFQEPFLCKDDFWNSMYSAEWLRISLEEKQAINGLKWRRKITRGQFIWQVGLTGLQVEDSFPDKIEKPRDTIGYSDFMYTLPHIHFQAFTRDEKWNRQTPLDPYDLYDFSSVYPTDSTQWIAMWEQHMFITSKEWLPMFVDEL